MPVNPDTILHAAPAAALGLMLVAGGALWLVGRTIARATYALLGGAIGVGVALVLSQAAGDRGLLLVWLAIGGLIGMILGWLLFRLCVAVSLALLLALALPGAIHYAAGGARPPILPAETRTALGDAGESAAARDLTGCHESLRQAYRAQLDAGGAWWRDLGKSRQQTLILAAAGGAIIGLVLGLIFPKTSSSLGTSFLGALLIAAGGLGLLALYKPDFLARLPHIPAVNLVLLGLITAGGVLVQCTLLKKKADK